MTLRRNTLVTVGVTIAGLILVLYIISQAILMTSFLDLEEREVITNVQRVNDALLDDIDFLETKAADWSVWDETYYFVNGSSEGYIDNYLWDETLINQRTSFMLFFNQSGDLVFSKGIDLQKKQQTPVPEGLIEHVSSSQFLLKHYDKESRVTGILLLPEHPVIITSQPIVTGSEEDPIGGTFVMGRCMNNAEIDKLSGLTHLDISIQDVNDPNMSHDFSIARSSLVEAGDEININPLDENSIAGYTLLSDVYGDPSLIIKVDMPRDVYNQGKTTLTYLVLTIIIVGAVFSSVSLIFLENSVLSRLSKLNGDVNSIAKKGDVSERVYVSGKDEISSLGTEINGMLDSLQESSQQLKRSNELKDLFTDILCHDLLNPSNVIKGYSNLLLEDSIEFNKKMDMIKRIDQNADRIIDMIASASKFAKLESVDELEFEERDIGSILKKVVEDFIPQIEDKNMKIELNASGSYPSKINPVIEEVFSNLLSNAIKYSPDTSRIIIDMLDERDFWKITFTDSGDGIPDRFKADIFERFKRADKKGVKGTGLGLAIVKRTVDLHDGKVGVEDNPSGPGSIFWVSLRKADEHSNNS